MAGVTVARPRRLVVMTYTQADIDSLAAKLNELSDAEKAALADLVANASVEVEGFQFQHAGQPDFGTVQWVFSPSSANRFAPVSENTIRVEICHQ